MSVDVYKQGNLMTTTKSMAGRKRCEGCAERVAFVIRKADGKWYCGDCANEKNPLIVMATDADQ